LFILFHDATDWYDLEAKTSKLQFILPKSCSWSQDLGAHGL